MARIGYSLLYNWYFVWCCCNIWGWAAAQDVTYGSGSMAGAILGTFFVTLLLVGIAYLFYRYYWKKDKNLVLVNDPENVKDEFAFDNPGFKTDAGGGWLRSQVPPPLTKAEGKENSTSNAAHPTPSLGPNPVLTPNRPGHFKDDTYLEKIHSRSIVPLWSRDFTGLGFEVSGGMREGIHVSSVLRGGPAAESGRIQPGDRINSITISFRHMVYEDAVAILSYASPYELRLEVESCDGTMSSKDAEHVRHVLAHPKLRRVASHADALYLEKVTRNHHSPKSQKSPNSTLEHKNTSASSAFKKIISEKIHTSTLERIKQHGHKDKKDVHHTTTLERENEKNAKNKHNIQLSPSPKFEKMKQPHDPHISKPERNNKQRNSTEIITGNINQISTPPDVVIIRDGGDKFSAKMEKNEVQKKEPEAKKGMKFGIRVLPPNVPDDGTIINNRFSKHDGIKGGSENGNIVAEIRSIDEVDKNFANNSRDSEETSKVKSAAPVVAKRREKPLAPVPNARNLPQSNVQTSSSHIEIKMDVSSPDRSAEYENMSFNRSDDLNSSGIKRDAQGIPQEIPKHMMEAAMYARNNRKSSSELVTERSSKEISPGKEPVKIEIRSEKESQASKNNKKSKGKAPSPPEALTFKSRDDHDVSSDNENNTNMTQETIINITNIKNMNFTDNFNDHNVSDIRQSAGIPTNRSDDMILNKVNTSTPKVEKVTKRMRPDIPTPKPTPPPQIELQDDIEIYDIKSFHKKEASDSLNNYFDDSKSNISSNMDGHSVISLSQDSFASNLNNELDKIVNAATTIELNSSDITIHSSPTNELETPTQELEDNERKAASLGDLSRLEPVDKNNKKPSSGTLERAQSLDISSEDAKINSNEKHITPKKRKSNSVFDGNYRHDNSNELPADSNENVNQILCQLKEPRLSLNINNISMEGLSTFQRNRLKKASEWGNLEDAILIKRDSSHSGSSELGTSEEHLNHSDRAMANTSVAMALEEETDKLNEEIAKLNKQLTGDVVEEPVQSIVHKDSTEILFNNKTLLPQDVSVPLTSPENMQQASDSTSGNTEYYKISVVKPDIQPRVKSPESFESRPNFEIGTYISDPNNVNKYKTETSPLTSSRMSPKLEDKLTMIYDTNIPDDIKVSRHTLVSSLERPKSDLMKKLLAQSPTLNVGIEKSTEQNNLKTDTEKNEHVDETGVDHSNSTSETLHEKVIDNKTNATSFTLLNQPDIVNLRIRQNGDEIPTAHETDYVSNINIVGATTKIEPSKINFDFNSEYPAVAPEKSVSRNFFSSNDNVVTITTDGSQPSSIITIEGDASGVQTVVDNYKNSIEIKTDFDKAVNAQASPCDNDSQETLYNEIMSELEKENMAENSENLPIISTNSKTYIIEGGSDKHMTAKPQYVIDTKTLDIPSQKTVTVNVSEDDMGNKIITQNVEETVTRVVTVTAAPIEVEEYTFGIIKNPTEADYKRLEEMETQNIDVKILADIAKQNPNIKLLSSDSVYTDSQTMMVNANMSEEEAKLLIEKLKANPGMMMPNRPEHAPGITIKETAVVVEEKVNNLDPHRMIKMTQASYKFKEDENAHPMKIIKMIESGGQVRVEADDNSEEQLTSEEINRIVDKINQSNVTPTTISENIFKKNNVNEMEEDPGVNRMEVTDPPVTEYVTEIEVRTPKSAASLKQSNTEGKAEKTRDVHNIFNEIDPSFMGDFLNNERKFSGKEKEDCEKFERRKSYSSETSSQNGIQKKLSNEDQSKRHSDFDLPRNTHIKFRTATYEPQVATPNKLTSSEKRLSQIEILKSNFEKGSSESLTSPKPLVSTKPSNIPIKLPDKSNSTHKTPITSPSKIPVLHTNTSPKVGSQENTAEKRTSPHNKPVSTGNITVTSIKSSRNPSGK